ncbi:iron hydrogenase small subunit [Candidatus Micrarchaeota archaeon]|nr:iron hydrogenase small subunit [Candidatus Micrarchaeota archaeon]
MELLSGDALFEKIEGEMKSGKIVIAEIAPAVRVTLGELFGFPVGANVLGKMTALLKKLGFAHVVDTPLGADIATYYEAEDIKRMLDSGKGKFPIFNSCCIGWRLYASRAHPELLGNITIIASPQMTIGAVSKYYIADKLKTDPSNVVVVGIMPCALKKYESMEVMRNGHKYIDYVVTTIELAQWAKKKGHDLKKLNDEPLSQLMPQSSKDGVMFGVTGGMTEAVMTTLAGLYGEKKEILDFRDDLEMRKKKVRIGKHVLKIAVVYGFQNFEKLYKEIKAGEKYHLVEVMMCPLGCVGGPGQPIAPKEIVTARGNALRTVADGIKERTPIDNPTVQKLIKEYLGKLPREKLEELIYFNR